MKTLHVIRTFEDALPFEIATHSGDSKHHGILLIQNGVYRKGPYPEHCYVAASDIKARGISSSLPHLEDDEICQMIIEYDRTIIW